MATRHTTLSLVFLLLSATHAFQSTSLLVSKRAFAASSSLSASSSSTVIQQNDESSSATATATATKEAKSLTTTKDDVDSETSLSSTIPLPPVIQGIADERREYQMNVGRAMDVLRHDMRDILNETPDFSIYHEDIEVIDPSGVRLNGLPQYKSAFAFFQTFLRFWFSSKSGLQFRMVYDFARCSIRISWHVVLVPKVFSLSLRPLHVDGISYYQLDRNTGKIIQHKIENLTINDSPVAPPYGIFSMVQQDMLRLKTSPKGVPAGISALTGRYFQ
mmetsp:Transcript_2285/g.3144  ORF Transcript_2285/g.3144 Transcript_2285/m.3144 type:complete len:275 (+) Transcript_2285:112-936(+)|eukprot:CAMPEP_0198143900 /NCGR_PEP_ID=MMETSP1443-20131203/11521_1 /TAXON_ID=186043 /ORGANISM="Entomoneis sp., Strain CCMP2396" /LENGTH=274 /DNA_ID=CAMNT_0043807205 /DNA_START=54 /DNA_END=878 /DNA_ORIENTATION=+